MKNTDLKDRILLKILPDVPFDGWHIELALAAAETLNIKPGLIQNAFPRGRVDLVLHFHDWVDRQMMKKLSRYKIENRRVRDRITLAVQTRLEILAPYKEAERMAIAVLTLPTNMHAGVKALYQTVDEIWHWAGDTSTDWNFYSKRFLLGGVITSTLLFWLEDKSKQHKKSWEFLDRRIENVMQIGKVKSKIKQTVTGFTFKKAS